MVCRLFAALMMLCAVTWETRAQAEDKCGLAAEVKKEKRKYGDPLERTTVFFETHGKLPPAKGPLGDPSAYQYRQRIAKLPRDQYPSEMKPAVADAIYAEANAENPGKLATIEAVMSGRGLLSRKDNEAAYLWVYRISQKPRAKYPTDIPIEVADAIENYSKTKATNGDPINDIRRFVLQEGMLYPPTSHPSYKLFRTLAEGPPENLKKYEPELQAAILKYAELKAKRDGPGGKYIRGKPSHAKPASEPLTQAEKDAEALALAWGNIEVAAREGKALPRDRNPVIQKIYETLRSTPVDQWEVKDEVVKTALIKKLFPEKAQTTAKVERLPKPVKEPAAKKIKPAPVPEARSLRCQFPVPPLRPEVATFIRKEGRPPTMEEDPRGRAYIDGFIYKPEDKWPTVTSAERDILRAHLIRKQSGRDLSHTQWQAFKRLERWIRSGSELPAFTDDEEASNLANFLVTKPEEAWPPMSDRLKTKLRQERDAPKKKLRKGDFATPL